MDEAKAREIVAKHEADVCGCSYGCEPSADCCEAKGYLAGLEAGRKCRDCDPTWRNLADRLAESLEVNYRNAEQEEALAAYREMAGKEGER